MVPKGSLLLLILASACASPASGSRARFAGIAESVGRGEAPKTKSVLVMRAGKIEHEVYFEGADAETLHDTRSVGKSMTSLAVGIAIERGVLPSVDVRVFEYLADLRPFAGAGPLKDGITVEDFLTMSSALDCDDDEEKSPGNEENMYPLQAWARWAVDIPTRADYQRDASGRGPWHYCTAGVFLLGQVIQRAAKQPIDELIAKWLFAPLGIKRWEFVRSPTNEVMTGGGLRLTSRELATIAEMIRSRGAYGGQQVVPATFIDRALTVHRNAFPEADYGYLFWHRTYHTRCGDFAGWYMSGNGGNAIVIVESLDAVIVVTRTFYSMGKKMHDQTASLIEQHILPELGC